MLPREAMKRCTRRRWLLVTMFAALPWGALGAGCASPTLPLPPPALPSVLAGSMPGTFRVSSIKGAEPNALVLLINRNTTLKPNERITGTFADEEGSWDVELRASTGDIVEVSQEFGSLRSPPVSVTIK